MISLLKKLYSLLPSGDLWKLISLILLMVGASVLELAGIGLIPAFVAILVDPDRLLSLSELSWVWDLTGVDDVESLFYFGVFALSTIFILKNIYLTIYHYIEGRFIWNRYYYISGNLFKRYMDASWTFHLNRNSSTILRNVTEEGRFLVSQVLAPMLKLTMNFIIAGCILLLLIYVETVISLIVLLLIGGSGALFLWLIRNKLSSLGEQANLARADMIKSVNEGLGGLKDIRVLRRESWFVNRFLSRLRSYSDYQTFFSVVVHSNKPVAETVAVLGMLVVSVTLFRWGDVESMIATMTLFGVATVRLMPAIREIMRDLNNLRYYSYSVTPIFEDFLTLNKKGSEESLARPADHDQNSVSLKNEIRFEGVSYAYPGTSIDAVSDVTFCIKKGSVVGLAGATGSGKTTIVDLILGLLTPQKGSITFDSVDLEDFLNNRTDAIGYVPQFIFLTDDTLERNIAFGLRDEEMDSSRVEKAIQNAQLSDVINELPDGVRTIVGERGVRLSGGQRQRIGIARALYHDPELLIMDEATSALDSQTEMEVIKAIERLRDERTIIIITHRLSTLEHCETVLFMERGRITDSGSLKELTKANEAFRRMRQQHE